MGAIMQLAIIRIWCLVKNRAIRAYWIAVRKDKTVLIEYKIHDGNLSLNTTRIVEIVVLLDLVKKNREKVILNKIRRNRYINW